MDQNERSAGPQVASFHIGQSGFKMLSFHMQFPIVLLSLLVMLSCNSEDNRLPQKLLEEARGLSNAGKTMEAKCILERITQRFPDTAEGKQANQDLFIIESTLKQELKEKQRIARGAMMRIVYALKRYKNNEGEYPWSLQELLPVYLDLLPETPWGHPFFYRPFVSKPIEEIKDRRGKISQKFNTQLDSYHMACLGTDLKPGGNDLARDYLVVDGEFYNGSEFPMIPNPQPVRYIEPVKASEKRREREKLKAEAKEKDRKQKRSGRK